MAASIIASYKVAALSKLKPSNCKFKEASRMVPGTVPLPNSLDVAIVAFSESHFGFLEGALLLFFVDRCLHNQIVSSILYYWRLPAPVNEARSYSYFLFETPVFACDPNENPSQRAYLVFFTVCH